MMSLVVLLSCLLGNQEPETRQQEPLTPEAAARKFRVADGLEFVQVLAEPHVRQPVSMKFDARGRLWVAEFIQYPYPAGLKIVSRDRYWRSVYDKVPAAPPNHERGLDRISIHEDTNGDGEYDTHSVFVDGLSIANSFAFGRGGVWVLNPPYLLFYPDADRDDVPDGDPVVHLQGFGLEDTHSSTNSLNFGPDGWLYSTQGSTVSGRVMRPGIDRRPISTTMGQLVWRYHPQTRRFEIFAEGGGNAYGVEFDAQGRLFSGHNGGNTRGFHYVQGGYFQKGFAKHGPLSNPYTFGYFSWMGHNDAPRFTHDFVIYEGGALPDKYDRALIGVGPLQSHLVMAGMERVGSTFKTRDESFPVQSEDHRFRPVEITVGPDGAVYVADFYEDQISHRQHFDGQIEKNTGRIYRLQSAAAKPQQPFNLRADTTPELIAALSHKNRWFRRTALAVLGERQDPAAAGTLLKTLRSDRGGLALECLWALNLSGDFDEAIARETLRHANPAVRAWTVRLIGDRTSVSEMMEQALVQRAREETHADVRSQLASTARRLRNDAGLRLVGALALRDADADDPHIPLLLWWAIEERAEDGRDAVLALFGDEEFGKSRIAREFLWERLVRRYARAGKRRDLVTAAKVFGLAPDKATTTALMKGFEKASTGRSLSGLPAPLVTALSRAGGGSESLRIRQRDPRALREGLKNLADETADDERRIRLINAFADLKFAAVVPRLLKIVETSKSNRVQTEALAALQVFSDDSIAARVVAAFPALDEDVRITAQTLLTSRAVWAKVLLREISEGRIPVDQISQDAVWRLQLARDPAVAKLTSQHFGAARAATSAQLRQRVRELEVVIREDAGDPYAGKKLFTATCAKCHRLFDSGGDIGPDLTSYQRDDLTRLLLNVVDPGAEIRVGFETWLAVTDSGRTVTGFKVDEDNDAVTLRGADGVSVTLPKGELDEFSRQPLSLMPTRLLATLSDQQVRDLFAYLRSSQPLNN